MLLKNSKEQVTESQQSSFVELSNTHSLNKKPMDRLLQLLLLFRATIFDTTEDEEKGDLDDKPLSYCNFEPKLNETHKLIQQALEFYLSDSNLLRDQYLQQYLGLINDFTNDNTGDHDDKKSEIFKNFIQTILTSQNEDNIEEATHQLILTLKSKNIDYLLKRYSQRRNFIDSDGYIWIEATLFLKFPRLSKIHSTLQDILQAAQDSPILKIKKKLHSTQKETFHKTIDSILDFISSDAWDKTILGSSGAGNISKEDTHNFHDHDKPLEDISEIVRHFKTLCHDGHERFHNEKKEDFLNKKTIYYIGRYWGTTKTLKDVATDIQARTIFIENIPLRCTPSHLKYLINFILHNQQLLSDSVYKGCNYVVHTSIPRYTVSRENKGFAFVELITSDLVEVIITILDNTWPKLWNNTNNDETSCHSEKLISNEFQTQSTETSGCVPYDVLYRQRIAHNNMINEQDDSFINSFSSLSTIIRRNKKPLSVLRYADWKIRKTAKQHSQFMELRSDDDVGDIVNDGCTGQHKQQLQNTIPYNVTNKPVWVELQNLGPPLSQFTIYQYVEATAVPLRVEYTSPSTTANVQMASIEDARHLDINAKLSHTFLGGIKPVNVIILDPEDLKHK